MREAGAKSGRVFVCRVVYGFVQALDAINVIPSFVNGRGEPDLPCTRLAYREFSKRESRSGDIN